MKLKNYKMEIIVFILVIVVFVVYLRNSSLLEKYEKIQIDSETLIQLSKSYFYDDVSLNSKQIFLFIDFTDFSCFTCEKQVNTICKSLQVNHKIKEKDKAIILIRKKKGNKVYYSSLMENWRKANNIEIPILLAKKDFFSQINITKTSIAILDKDQELIEYEEFPLKGNTLSKFIKLFETDLLF